MIKYKYMTIDEFIEKLSEYKNSDTVFNMYRGNSVAAKKCRKNLKEYLEKIEPENIMRVECERDDPFYDTSLSGWEMKVKLRVHGWDSVATIKGPDSHWYKKILGMVEKSNDFEHKSIENYSKEEGFWYGRFSYTRKKNN